MPSTSALAIRVQIRHVGGFMTTRYNTVDASGGKKSKY